MHTSIAHKYRENLCVCKLKGESIPLYAGILKLWQWEAAENDSVGFLHVSLSNVAFSVSHKFWRGS